MLHSVEKIKLIFDYKYKLLRIISIEIIFDII